MTKTTDPPEAQDPPAEPAAPSNAELAQRVDGLSSKIDTILSKLGGDARAAEPAEPKQPASVADEIRQQLDERKRAEEAKAAAEGDAAWRKGVDERLAGMAEKVPEAPVRRVEKIMGWRN